jgi:multisubunit Na+/H+ antiporter MnhC subunit
VNGIASLWFGLLGGTVAWAAHLLVSYFVVAAGCENLADDLVRALLVAVTVITGALAAIALAVAQRVARTARTWRRSLARAGVLLDALGLFGIALAGTLPFAIRTC